MHVHHHSEATNGLLQALIVTAIALLSVLALLDAVAPIT